jgi:hypothetical protein
MFCMLDTSIIGRPNFLNLEMVPDRYKEEQKKDLYMR